MDVLMPTMPWTPLAATEPDREYLVMATRFVLSRHRHLPAVVRSTQALWPALTRSSGLLGYSLYLDLPRRALGTLSVWRDGDAVEAFVRSEPHALVVAQTRAWMADSTFVTWTVPGAQLPVDWNQARERLDTATGESTRRHRADGTALRPAAAAPGFGAPL